MKRTPCNSVNKKKGELAERYCTGLLSQGWDNTQVSSILTLSAMFVMSQFDDEEKRYQSMFMTNKWCFGRDGLCIPLKTGLRRFESFGYHVK